VKLIISDLDHTLVDVFWLHDQTTQKIFRKYFGKDAWLHEIDHAGRSQPDGLHTLAIAKGIPEEVFQSKAPEMIKEFYNQFVADLPIESSKFILPGVGELLERLTRTGNILVLYTGDSPIVGQGILKATGLDRYFSYRFFGTEFERRSDMIRAAIKKVKETTGREFYGTDIVVIGDSIRDVECGKEFNAITIAVATGQHTPDQLIELKPDLLVKSLAEIKAIIEVIGQ
jgi:phosphoglycolate phosphatase